MVKDETKTFLKQTERIIGEVGSKIGKLAKALEKDAVYGTKAGMVKIEQMTLESEKNKLMNEVGRKAYELLKSKKISHKSLDELVKKIKEIDNKIRGKKTTLISLKKKRKSKV